MLKSLQRKTRGDLRANWRQFLAVWVVVVLGTAFYGAMYPAGQSVVTSIYNTYDQLALMDFQIKLAPAAERVVDAVCRLPKVAAVEGRLSVESGVQLDPAHAYLTNLRLISVPDNREPQVNRSDIPVGHALEGDDQILLLKRFADRHGIRVGDRLAVWINGQKHLLRVAGLAFNPEYLVAGRSPESPFPAASAFGVAWMRYSRLAELAGQNGQINEMVVRLAGQANTISDERLAEVRTDLEAALAHSESVEIRSRVQTPSGGIIDANVKGNFSILTAFSMLFLAGAVLITGILLGRLVESERQRIGTLRALGVTRSELIGHYLTFGLLLGVTGGLVGSVAGYFTSFAMMYPFVATLAGGYLPGFVNAPQIPFILLGWAIVILGTTLAGAYSAWRESGTPPGIALRPPTPASPSVLSRIPLGGLPLIMRQTLRNLLRVPGRSLGAAAGVMAGAVMVFLSFALLNTVDSSFSDQLNAGHYEFRVVISAPKKAETLEAEIRHIAGVQAVQAALAGPVTLQRSNGLDFDTLATSLDEKTPFLELVTLEGEKAFSSGEGVWIGQNLKRVLNVQVGDRLTVQALGQDRQVKVLGIVSQTLGSPMFVPRSLIAQWMPGKIFKANMALVRVAPGQAAAVRDALADLPDVVAVEDYPAFVRDILDYIQYWRQNSLIFGFFGWLLTAAVILNAVSANLHEQQSELAILRSLGVPARDIALGVLLELLAMSVLGIAIGAPFGQAIGFQLLRSYDMDFYGLVPHAEPIFYVVGMVSMVGMVALAALPGLHAVQKADLGQVSKAQSI